MSDNRSVDRAIRTAIRQLFPSEPKENFTRNLDTLVGFDAYLLLFAKPILASIACIGKLVIIIDGSEEGYNG